MTARDNTEAMLRWWWHAGITDADLAVRRSDGAMIWHHGVGLRTLPLSWARAENIRGAEVYIRPARGPSWPLVFLDDLAVADALAIARKYDALVVETSQEGGCHLWLSCTCPLDEHSRRDAQKWLVQRVGADPASTSGEHLGRLAGFKNHKRGGNWVNVLEASRRGQNWAADVDGGPSVHPNVSVVHRIPGQTDSSPSGQEWGWVCGMLEAGHSPAETYQRLVKRAELRRGKDAERYACHTIGRALDHVGRARSRT